MITKRHHTKGYIERLDGEWAILVQPDYTRVRLSRFALPNEIREGYYIEETDQPGQYVINYEVTEKRQRDMRWMSESCCN